PLHSGSHDGSRAGEIPFILICRMVLDLQTAKVQTSRPSPRAKRALGKSAGQEACPTGPHAKMRHMRIRILAAALLACLCAVAQSTLTIDQLLSFIKSSIQLKQSDKQVAQFLSRVKLLQKLDDRTIEEMQGQGAGPKTLDALRLLRDQSQSLPGAGARTPEAKPVPIPPPSSEEQARILDEVRHYVLNYSKSLPDYICTQVVRRYAAPRNSGSWQLLDTLTIRLSYFEQKEDYKLIMVNNQVTQQNYHQIGGATSSGEFGSMTKMTFEPKTFTRFEWDHWGTLRGRRSLVFKYRVAQMNSEWHIIERDAKLDIITAYHGLVYVDRETHQVLRMTLDAEDIPPSFPVREARTVLDYDYVDISGRRFLLPLK